MCVTMQRCVCYRWDPLSGRLKAALQFILCSPCCPAEPQAHRVTKPAISPTRAFHFLCRQSQSCHHQTARNLIQAKLMFIHKALSTLGALNTWKISSAEPFVCTGHCNVYFTLHPVKHPGLAEHLQIHRQPQTARQDI